MPYGDPDTTDPMTLNGVLMDNGEALPLQAVGEMAECFIDEYARLGFDESRILRMFHNPGYAGPFMANEHLGEQTIRRLVTMVLERWGGRRTNEMAMRTGTRQWSLTVLDG
ncbi:MAG: hypothetical protein HY287_11090 [Planctomycetes bacterium]|nr:hypothetical protein [Planctomycetota bacterium]MBI3834863.1 hypothetical protein [Planctomycetota bacterium]